MAPWRGEKGKEEGGRGDGPRRRTNGLEADADDERQISEGAPLVCDDDEAVVCDDCRW